MKYILNVSGGGTKAVGLAAVAIKVIEKYGLPIAYSGNSAGAIIAIALLLGKKKALINATLNVENSHFFDRKFNLFSASRFIYRYLRGERFIGLSEMTNLEKSIRKYVSHKEFNRFQRLKIPTIVSYVDIRTGKMVRQDLSTKFYTMALKHIRASSSIPITSEPVDGRFVDGGLREHISSPEMIEEFHPRIDRCISIYSRPKDLTGSVDHTGNVFENTYAIGYYELSKSDEEKEETICDRYQIDLERYFLPKVLKNTYDTNKARLLELKKQAEELQPEIIKFGKA